MTGSFSTKGTTARTLWRGEAPLLFVVATTIAYMLFGKAWLADLSNPLWLALMFAWLFGTILWAALKVVHHADMLAETLGEPYGTLSLSLSLFLNNSVDIVSASHP